MNGWECLAGITAAALFILAWHWLIRWLEGGDETDLE